MIINIIIIITKLNTRYIDNYYTVLYSHKTVTDGASETPCISRCSHYGGVGRWRKRCMVHESECEDNYKV